MSTPFLMRDIVPRTDANRMMLITKLKKAQLMTRMVTDGELSEAETRFWETKSGLVPVLSNPTGFKNVSEDVFISEPNIYKKI